MKKKDWYMLVRKGFVQRLMFEKDGIPAKAWPIADNLQDAKRLCKLFNNPKIRPALIGSVEGETVAGHIRLAIEEGCFAVGRVKGWAEDGEPIWDWLIFD
jgi:hypothetical protein